MPLTIFYGCFSPWHLADKSEKAGKSKKKHRPTSKKAGKSLECRTEVVKSEDVYHLSSGDDDCSKGMKST